MNGAGLRLKDTLISTQEARVTVAGLPMIDICFIHELQEAGLHIFPCKPKDKSPLVKGSWREKYCFTDREKYEAIAMACGLLSGGVEVIDIDKPQMLDLIPQEFKDMVIIDKTQSGGYHLIYRCEVIEGNQKLANEYLQVENKGAYSFAWKDKQYESKEFADGFYISAATIETRGEGGYILIPPSPGYMTLRGDLKNIPVISVPDRNKFIFYLKSLSEQTPRQKHQKVIKRKEPSACVSPGDAFSYSQTAEDLLSLFEKHGWQQCGRTGNNYHLRRPGKMSGSHSASLGGDGDFPIFYVFSTNDSVFEGGKGYSPFQAFALLEHGGNFRAAAKVLFLREYGTRNPEIEVLTKDDIEDETNTSTPFSMDMIPPGSLIEMGMAGLIEAGAIEIPQILFPIVISHIARATNGAIECGGVFPSFAFIKVAGTSVGKTESDKLMMRSIAPLFSVTKTILRGRSMCETTDNAFYGPASIASGQAILTAFEGKPKSLLVLDEITSLFASNGKKRDPIAEDKRNVILELSTRSGMSYEKQYANNQNSFVINDLLFNMIGNATPVIFDHFTEDDLNTGTIQRLDFSVYDGPIPERKEAKSDTATLTKFGEKLRNLMAVSNDPAKQHINLTGPQHLGVSKEARKRLAELSKQIVADMNEHNYNAALQGIISRQYDRAIKYALVHAAATRTIDDLFSKELSISDIDYGCLIAGQYVEWQKQVLLQNVYSGEFHMMCEEFKKGIAAGAA